MSFQYFIGPANWPNIGYPECGQSSSQSPVHIRRDSGTVDARLTQFVYEGYSYTGQTWTLKNNGHSGN